MILDEVGRLLREEIGLHVASVGGAVVQYAVKTRMAACGFPEPLDYLQRLSSSRQEMQELINAVVIPETWFFRDREAFVAMVRHARAHRRPGAPLRMLSLPCSTGEEPYSLAMAMFDAGFAASDFTIDGVDISTRNIAAATRAVYGRNSFRGADIAFRSRHFEAVEGGHRPSAAVLDQVTFKAGNLFDPAVTPPVEAYDVIFCRNLLIYFDRELQQRSIGRLRQMLVPGGLLLVGPAESSLPTLHGFVSARTPLAFAFYKQDAAPPAEPRPGPSRPRRASPPAVARAGGVRAAASRPEAGPKPAARSAAPVEAPGAAELSLTAIQRAADAGRLDEAKREALAHLAAFGPSADAYYLLGLAHDASQAISEAIENYRKALYLSPDHRETLAHLALALERRGDGAGAKVLSDRLGRIADRSRSQ
ncbi:chemotaxis protein methyltransferase WspC [Methylopila capsulata]|uniref:Methyltransferase n=1 Tax=Methylopila capsulata TaxID=61654 RepID=A0A9W6ISF4_9HYPH|nr:CheR family methyltransferase [Methylopila capsulata]MBM7850388.1 chemotaxis protein methyltransferase WspC [Methylopila capsulata]GLK55681.1 methyltransferase [Methylopila capsulata]